MDFKIINMTIKLSDEFTMLNELRKKFLDYRKESVIMFKGEADKRFKTIEELKLKGEEFGNEFLDSYILKALEDLKELGVNNIDFNEFKDKYYSNDYCIWNKLFKEESGEVNDEFNLISRKKENDNDDLSNIIDKITNIISESVFNIHYEILDLCDENTIATIENYSSTDDISKANKSFKKLISGSISKENERKIIRRIIRRNPYNEEFYRFLVLRYGDKNNGIEELCEYLGFDTLRECKYQLLHNYIDNILINEKDFTKVHKEFNVYAESLGIENYSEYTLKIDNMLEKFNSEKNESRIGDTLIISQGPLANIEVDSEIKKAFEGIDKSKESLSDVSDNVDSVPNEEESGNLEEVFQELNKDLEESEEYRKSEEDNISDSGDLKDILDNEDFKNERILVSKNDEDTERSMKTFDDRLIDKKNEDNNKVNDPNVIDSRYTNIGNVNEKLKVDEEKLQIDELKEKSKETNDKGVGLEKDKNLEKYENKKNVIVALVALAVLIIIYLAFVMYFSQNFYNGTTINGFSVGGKNVEEVKQELMVTADDYTLELVGRDDRAEVIKGIDIGLRYNYENKIEEIKEGQNPYMWISEIFKDKNYTLEDGCSYDEVLFTEVIDELSFFHEENIIQPQNATIENINGSYEIVEEVKGNLINKEKLYRGVEEAVLTNEKLIELEGVDCYENPEYVSTSPELVSAKDTINKYISSQITYLIGENSEILDSSTINSWVSIDENFNVILDESQVRGYINTLGSKYDNLGNVRDFTHPYGGVLKVSTSKGISYIDRSSETQELVSLIKGGEKTNREPVFVYPTTSSLNSYVVNTFVEIDLSSQYVWFYKNGTLITEGKIVTGDVSKGYATPPGVFGLTYKDKDAVLRGPGYEAPVDYWMPFNGDIGLHDATWRNSFGGEIYKNDGSHGCVNLPYNVAQAIFNNIEAGNIVICRY